MPLIRRGPLRAQWWDHGRAPLTLQLQLGRSGAAGISGFAAETRRTSPGGRFGADLPLSGLQHAAAHAPSKHPVPPPAFAANSRRRRSRNLTGRDGW